MLSWLSANLGTIIVSAVLLAVVALVIFIMIRDKRAGKSACSHSCGSCAMSAECQRRAEEFRRKKAAEKN
ncbi:MAG: FeoB-associated Cys-rich membrane protein [Lachnospiraceae bacterium]|nr:FeoB-associated Cys-rich membrane protein [Lachnospiraceae bacterium]